MKLSIVEDFESTTSIGTQMNPLSICSIGDFDIYGQQPVTAFDAVTDEPVIVDAQPAIGLDPFANCETTECCCGSAYCELEKLGLVLLLASNDIHTIHINATGKDFTRLHLDADELYKQLNDYGDTCLEMSVEDGHFINPINKACEITGWNCCNVSQQGYQLIDGTREIVRILGDVSSRISEIYDCVDTNIQSTLDEWSRYIDSKRKYFLGRILQESKKRKKNESVMSASVKNMRRNRKALMRESINKLELGKSYKDFYQVEDHIQDYDIDIVDLKKGDYIIRDFQFGHLPNGGNKGYIPYEVVDIEYDRDEDKQGYWDARKRLHVYDGEEDFYIEVYNERFNGMFHRLKKSSIKR